MIDTIKEFEMKSSLGKGEVARSIRAGSTTNLTKIKGFSAALAGGDVAIAQNVTRTAHVHPWKIRGLCSAGVRAAVNTSVTETP